MDDKFPDFSLELAQDIKIRLGAFTFFLEQFRSDIALIKCVLQRKQEKKVSRERHGKIEALEGVLTMFENLGEEKKYENAKKYVLGGLQHGG